MMQLANSVPQSPLVNRFCVLDIAESNTSTCEPIVAPSSSSVIILIAQRPKWKKRLPKQLSISILDVHGASLILTIELCTVINRQ